MHDALVEGIVIGDDDLMERYLGDEKIEIAELAQRARRRRRDRHGVPGAVRQRDEAHRHRPAGEVPRRGSARADGRRRAGRSRIVFKTIVDPYVGHVNLFKVLQGTVKHDDVLANSAHARPTSACTSCSRCAARSRTPSTEVAAGDIAAVAKLADTRDRRRARGQGRRRSRSTRCAPPEPVLAVAIHAKTKGDEDKLANALHRLQEEDPVLRIERNPETHQTVLRGMGETHLSIALEKLARKFGVEVETEDVRVAYRETISGNGRSRRASSRSRAAATASSRSRGCASSRPSAARATSSSTRSSAA